MSNSEPWRGHSTVQFASSKSPSASGPLSWEQRSSIAYRVPLQLKTPISRSSHSTSFLWPGFSSEAGHTSMVSVLGKLRSFLSPTVGLGIVAVPTDAPRSPRPAARRRAKRAAAPGAWSGGPAAGRRDAGDLALSVATRRDQARQQRQGADGEMQEVVGLVHGDEPDHVLAV